MRTMCTTACAERRARRLRGGESLALLPVLLSCVLVSGCVRFTWRSVEHFQPPEPAAVEGLVADATLAECLERLGAPWQVLEQEEQPGLVLIYAWEKASGWVASVSSGQRSIPGSLTVGRGAAGWSSLMLWFDEEDRLERWEQGSLTPELASALTRRLGT